VRSAVVQERRKGRFMSKIPKGEEKRPTCSEGMEDLLTGGRLRVREGKALQLSRPSIPSLQVGLFSFSFGYFTHKSTLPPLLHDSAPHKLFV